MLWKKIDVFNLRKYNLKPPEGNVIIKFKQNQSTPKKLSLIGN